jgi:hypothetical protein
MDTEIEIDAVDVLERGRKKRQPNSKKDQHRDRGHQPLPRTFGETSQGLSTLRIPDRAHADRIEASRVPSVAP